MDAQETKTYADFGWRPERCGRVALVLQGGGALGAYQVGVYQAMHEAGIEPDWVSGVSIGAINSAIIAGNPPAERAAALQDERYTAAAFRPPAKIDIGFKLGSIHGVI